MAFAAFFAATPPMTKAQFDEINRRIDEIGHGHPVGRIFHVGYGNDDSIEVVDVWDNEENFNNFGAVLMPVLAEFGVDVGNPTIAPIQRIRPE